MDNINKNQPEDNFNNLFGIFYLGMEKRYTDRELEQFKDLLDHKLAIAREELESHTASLGQGDLLYFDLQVFSLARPQGKCFTWRLLIPATVSRH